MEKEDLLRLPLFQEYNPKYKLQIYHNCNGGGTIIFEKRANDINYNLVEIIRPYINMMDKEISFMKSEYVFPEGGDTWYREVWVFKRIESEKSKNNNKCFLN